MGAGESPEGWVGRRRFRGGGKPRMGAEGRQCGEKSLPLGLPWLPALPAVIMSQGSVSTWGKLCMSDVS